MKTFPFLLASSALLAATAIAPSAFAQDPAFAAPSPGYGYGSGAPPAAAYPAPIGYDPTIYGASAGYDGPDSPGYAYRDSKGTERRSPAMMITGFSMVGIGVGGVITGALFFAANQSVVYGISGCYPEIPDCPNSSPSRSLDAGAVGGIAAMVSGGLIFAVGLPLGIVGARRKPLDDQASPIPQVSVGPTGGGARWTF